MHLSNALLMFAVLSAVVVAQRPGGPGGGRRESRPVELQHLTFAEKSFHSEAVDRDMKYGIYLPKDYDAEANKDKKWPLVIWLHGMHEDHLRFHGRGGAPVLDAAIGDGKLPPCVFVTANGGSTSMYVNRKDQRWEDLVSKDLLAHVTATYRVSDARDQRAILGVSMGGMAALRIAFTQPDLFGCVGAHSAAVFDTDPDKLPDRIKGYANRLGLDEVFGNPIQKEPWQQANPLCLALALDKKALHGLRIYFDAGTEDRYGFADGNEKLHQALEKKGIEHTWRLIEGGGHSWGAGFQDQTLPFSFAMVGEMFQTATARQQGLKGLQGALGGDNGDGKGDGKGKDPAPRQDGTGR